MTHALPRPDEGLLVRDEDAIDRILADVVYAIERADNAKAVQYIRQAADRLERHMCCEEDVVFPALAAVPGMAEEIVRFQADHRDLKRQLDEVMHDLLRDCGPMPQAKVSELRRCLARHAADEEREMRAHAAELPKPWPSTLALLFEV